MKIAVPRERAPGERRVALALLDDAHRLGDFLLEVLAHPGVERCVGLEQRVLAFRLAGFLRQLIDRFDV